MARSRIGTAGGQNICIVAAIENGDVSTTSGKYFIFDMTKSTQIGQLAKGVAGKTVTLTSYANNPDLDTFIATYAGDAVEAAEANRFEDGTEYAGASSSLVTLAFGLLGGTASGKIQTFYGTCALTDGDITQEYNTPVERNITLTTQAWNGSAALDIPSGFWELFTKVDGTTKYLKTTTPTPALPTTMAVGTASQVIWLETA